MTVNALHADQAGESSGRYIDVPTRSIAVGGTAFALRDLGPRSGVPLILLNHWGAVLDNFAPRIVDGLAHTHRVIAIDYRGTDFPRCATRPHGDGTSYQHSGND